MSDTQSPSDDEIMAQLEALRLELLARVWPMAAEAARTRQHDAVRELVKLQVDIEAIDFAMSHRPGRIPT